jgi:very-short-patch-repair endonuclease
MDDVAVVRSDSPTEVQERERAVAELARRQHGVVAKRQLIALGVGEGAIKHRLGVGRMHRVHAGVYALGHLALSADGNRMAAVLAAGPDARLSHRDAAALWDLRATAHTRIDVSVPRSGLRSRQGLNVHCTAPWHPDDCANRRGIPVTSVARTLLDVAEVVSRRAFRHIFEEAERLRLVDVRAIQAVVARGHGRRGVGALAAVLAEARTRPLADTRSELERRFVDLVESTGLPPPATNVLVEGFLVDAVWPRKRLVVELDGRRYHHTRAAFERDRIRDAGLQVAGYRVLRITWTRLDREPDVVAATIRALLGP